MISVSELVITAPPRRPPGWAPPIDAAGEHEEAFVRPQRILVVEDNWLVALETEATLEEAGYTVVGISVSAEEAVQACRTERPNLVLMDIRLLGERDGIEAAIEIRRQFGIGSVFVSAHDEPQMRARAEAARPLGWILKPVTGPELIRSLADLSKDGGTQ